MIIYVEVYDSCIICQLVFIYLLLKYLSLEESQKQYIWNMYGWMCRLKCNRHIICITKYIKYMNSEFSLLLTADIKLEYIINLIYR